MYNELLCHRGRKGSLSRSNHFGWHTQSSVVSCPGAFQLNDPFGTNKDFRNRLLSFSYRPDSIPDGTGIFMHFLKREPVSASVKVHFCANLQCSKCAITNQSIRMPKNRPGHRQIWKTVSLSFSLDLLGFGDWDRHVPWSSPETWWRVAPTSACWCGLRPVKQWNRTPTFWDETWRDTCPETGMFLLYLYIYMYVIKYIYIYNIFQWYNEESTWIQYDTIWIQYDTIWYNNGCVMVSELRFLLNPLE